MERDVTSGILNAVVIFLGAPMLMGVINKTKACVGGRRGPALLQMYYDLAKLLRKGFVVSTTTTWVFLAGPVVAMSAAIVAAVLLPLAGRPAWMSFTGDMILFVYVFGLARFFVASAAMDTGSAFEGMGAAREVTFSALAEPALFFGMLGLARISGSLSLSHMLDLQASHAWQKSSASIVLIIVSWFIVLLAENARVPIDDPNTHLELTMIHEVMVLDHGGPAFGLVLYACRAQADGLHGASGQHPRAYPFRKRRHRFSCVRCGPRRCRRGHWPGRIEYGALAPAARTTTSRDGDPARRFRRRASAEVTTES